MRYHYTMYPHLIRFRNKHITASSALAAGSDTRVRHDTYNLTFAGKRPLAWAKISILHEKMDTLGFEPRAFRMRSGCDTTTPCALCILCPSELSGPGVCCAQNVLTCFCAWCRKLKLSVAITNGGLFADTKSAKMNWFRTLNSGL
jgi:hypothetical protein